MSKLVTGTIAAALLASSTVFAAPAHAAIYYPWCIQYGGGREGYGATSCGFVSRAQCMESASGMGAACVENPVYPEHRERAVKSRHKKKKKSQ
jgi:hypothetical protein